MYVACATQVEVHHNSVQRVKVLNFENNGLVSKETKSEIQALDVSQFHRSEFWYVDQATAQALLGGI